MPGFSVWKAMTPEAAEAAANDSDYEFPDWLPEELLTSNVVRASQSFLTAWQHCPSSAVAEQKPTYGEAAAIGIVAHSIADGRVTHQGVFDEVDRQYAQEKLDELAAQGWVPKDPEAFMELAYAKAAALTQVYLDKYHRYTLDGEVETEVSGRLIWDVRDRKGDVDYIVITGTADMLATRWGRRVGVDLKSGARMPEPWMVRRYGVQWRIYAVMFELDEMYFEYPLALNPLNGGRGDWVANKHEGVVHCQTTPEGRKRFEEQLIAEAHPIAEALLRSTDPEDHVIRPTDWHCSRYCQRFRNHECIGAHVELDWVATEHEKLAKVDGYL